MLWNYAIRNETRYFPRKAGLFIQPLLFWLGVTPNGLNFDKKYSDYPSLLKIKCPSNRRKSSSVDLLSDQSFYLHQTKVVRLYGIIMSGTSFKGNPHSIVCLNVKELLDQSRCYIWSLSDSNVIRTHTHLVHQQKLSHLAKLAAKWFECSFMN